MQNGPNNNEQVFPEQIIVVTSEPEANNNNNNNKNNDSKLEELPAQPSVFARWFSWGAAPTEIKPDNDKEKEAEKVESSSSSDEPSSDSEESKPSIFARMFEGAKSAFSTIYDLVVRPSVAAGTTSGFVAATRFVLTPAMNFAAFAAPIVGIEAFRAITRKLGDKALDNILQSNKDENSSEKPNELLDNLEENALLDKLQSTGLAEYFREGVNSEKSWKNYMLNIVRTPSSLLPTFVSEKSAYFQAGRASARIKDEPEEPVQTRSQENNNDSPSNRMV